jgi:steroid 5-alpha reductase family enzyme
MNLIALLVISLLILIFLFGICSIIAERIKNYGIVDILWSYAFGLLVLICFFLAKGSNNRKILITALVLVWSIRLGTHLLIRVSNHHPKEDTRYSQLRLDWSENLVFKMACFFQIQAISVIILSIPFYIISQNTTKGLNSFEILGSSIWIIGVAGESLADIQLAQFKKVPGNRHEVCNQGLWKYSRHPNYFFEWIIWVSYFIIACGSPYGWISIISPITILYLLLTKTGVPMAEKQSLISKKEKYAAYQKTTSVFFPWFPKVN